MPIFSRMMMLSLGTANIERLFEWRKFSPNCSGKTCEAFLAARFTFPDCNHSPSEFAKCKLRFCITANITFNFFPPEFRLGSGPPESLAAMAMPEAAVDEYRHSVTRQHDVRFARQVAAVKAEPETKTVQ
jgi:hypothetical protein